MTAELAGAVAVTRVDGALEPSGAHSATSASSASTTDGTPSACSRDYLGLDARVAEAQVEQLSLPIGSVTRRCTTTLVRQSAETLPPRAPPKLTLEPA